MDSAIGPDAHTQAQNHNIPTLVSKYSSSILCEWIATHPGSLHKAAEPGTNIVIEIDETDSTFSTERAESEPPVQEQCESIVTPTGSMRSGGSFARGITRLNTCRAPSTNLWMKVKEAARLTYTRTKVTLEDLSAPYEPISHAAQFAHYFVEPLYSHKGKNERVMLGQCLANAQVQDGNGKIRNVVHAASHNYAGFYDLTPGSEELQRLCLDSLPVTPMGSVPSLEAAVHDELARLFDADFCYTTNTGYGSNLLAFSAILDSTWLVIMDEKCHNSMHVGAYVSMVGRVRKFRHNDLEHLESIIQENSRKYANVLVAVEGLYSMDGTIPPLDQLAHLKQRFGFTILADEAHSLQSLGKTGRGCVELWNDDHPEATLPLDLFDIRTATLSKACGAIGGLVCGRAKFQNAVLSRREELLTYAMEPLSPSAMVQTLYVLGQPTQLQRRLRHLRHMVAFVREELQRYGIYVYGNAVTPVLPLHTGRPSLAAKFSYVLRQLDVLATPVATPAVPMWESRVRVCLSPDHDDQTVNRLVSAIINAARIIGITRKTKLQQTLYHYTDEKPTKQEEFEAIRAQKHIRELILRDRSLSCGIKYEMNVLQAGHAARQQYGLASGGARWVTGTFQVHVEVEQTISKLTGMPDAFTYVDPYTGLMSTVAALCRPLIGYDKHYFFVPINAPAAVLDGFRVAPKKGAPVVMRYDDLESLAQSVRAVAGRKAYITLYADITGENSKLSQSAIFKKLNRAKVPSGMTILLNDIDRSGRRSDIDPQFSLAEMAKLPGVRLLVYGSFYRMFGLPGAYLAGNTRLLRELRYTSRGYMFTTSQPPYVMGMIAEALKAMLRCCDARDESPIFKIEE